MEKVLEFTAQGNAIISELLKISELIPDEFKLSETSKKYNEIIVDFTYFKSMDLIDKKIDANQQLCELDETLRDSYSRILMRFYAAFESVYEYAIEFNIFTSQLNAGDFIQESLETIFQDPEGCQLICEAVYLYAVMLIVLDIYIPGPVRERLLVAYYRYHSQNTDSNVDDICKFCRSTGYAPVASKMTFFQPYASSVKGYPENFFSRVRLDETLVSMTIETLKTEDIYHQMQKFPSPEHRTTALAAQSSMLFLCLYFQSDTLTSQHSRMREICDKFFYNNWVISLYMGLTVNLVDAWDGYKAAKAALSNILQPHIIKEITANNVVVLKKMLDSTKGLLKEGVLNESFLMKNLPKITKVIRECNFCVRWWILNHAASILTKKSKVHYDCVTDAIEWPDFDDKLYELILNVSQLELVVREITKDLLENKDEKWKKYKFDIKDIMKDLITLFTNGDKTVLKVEKNENLTAWFEDILKTIEAMELQQKPRVVEKKLVSMIEAFSEVGDYHNIQSNAYAKQRIDEILNILSNMIHLMHIKDSVLVDLQAIGDFNYAWYLIDEYTDHFHKSIQKSPSILIRLRSLFIKISSALEIPLLRINQFSGGAEELVSIVNYYSNALVKYVRKIVQIIPHSIFNLLKSIIEIQTNHLKELPEKLDKDRIREYAQLDERYRIAKLTFNISVFTDGIMAMKKTLVGVIELDPKQLLEDGIRMELVSSVAKAFHENLQFNGKPKNPKDLMITENLVKLSNIIDGHRRSFEYIQDYLNMNGLKIWREEVMRIIFFNVEQECNCFMKRKIQFSRYQNDAIPITIYPVTNINDPSVTFIGRLGRELLRITDPKITVYVDLLTAWFDYKTHQEIIDVKFSRKIIDSLEIYGLVGIDKLYSYMISNELEMIYKNILKTNMKEKQWLELFQKFTTELAQRKSHGGKIGGTSFENPYKKYQQFNSKLSKLSNIFTHIMSIGQKQIWRNHIAYLLKSNARVNCRNLHDRLINLNDALLCELKAHAFDSSNPKPSTQLLLTLNKHLEMIGHYEPIEKVYVKMSKSPDEFLTFLVIFTLSNLNKLAFGENLMKFYKASGIYAQGITKQRKILIDMITSGKFVDGHVFLLGITTLMRQFFENDYIEDYITLTGECILEMIEYNLSCSNKTELNQEISNGIDLLEKMIKLTGTPRSVLENVIPQGLLEQRDYMITVVNAN